jgi:hypothetical protein
MFEMREKIKFGKVELKKKKTKKKRKERKCQKNAKIFFYCW